MSKEALFCLPVVRIGAVFRQAGPDEASVRDLIPYEDLSVYLHQHYTIEPATVHVFGQATEVDVYWPKDDPNEFAYVLVDSDLAPIPRRGEAPEAPDEISENLREALALHIESMITECEFTDGMFVPTRQNLPWAFIWPRLVRRQVDSFGLPSLQTIPPRECSVDDLTSVPRAVILGEAGSGKTTLLRYLALRMCAQWVDATVPATEWRVPVYVQLRHFDFRQELSMRTAMRAWHEVMSGPSAPRLVWILDGLDEVPTTSLTQAKEAIVGLMQGNKRDSVLVCSRIASYDGFLRSQSEHFELQPFSWSQTTQWVHQYVREFDESRVIRLLRHLSNVPELRRVAANPLLLSVLTHLYQFEDVVPQQRVQFLERFVSTLCTEWDSCRGVTRRGPKSLPPYRRSTLLGWVAYEMKHRGVASVRSEELVRWLTKYPPLGPDLDLHEVLKELAEDTGLLVAVGPEGGWEFSHSIFCDYLAARHLVSRADDVVSLLGALAGGDSWHDVWILACSVTDDARPLLETVLTAGHLSEETRALLVMGALAQGLNLDSTMIDRCRTLVGDVFVRHAHQLSGSVRLRETTRGLRLDTDRVPPNDSQAGGGSSRFVSNLLAMLYRARWWRMGQTVADDMRERGGAVGEMVARLVSYDGTMALPKNAETAPGEDLKELLAEIDTTRFPEVG